MTMLNLKPFIEKNQDSRLDADAVMILQHGQIIAEHRFGGPRLHNVYSVAKTYLVTAIGMAVDGGLLHLDDKPVNFFPELFDELSDAADPRWQAVTLEHLLTMTAGHDAPAMMSANRKKLRGKGDAPAPKAVQNEWLRFAFTRPMAYTPGTHFQYSNLAPYVAGRMLEKKTGCSVRDYLAEKLWQPLGEVTPRWDSDPAGHTFPASDLFADIGDMIKLGQLYLNRGVLDGRRYVSEAWIQAATCKHIDSDVINPAGDAADERCGYGYYLWMNHIPHAYCAYGRESQFVVVLPDQDAVIAVQAMHPNTQEMLDALWETILPQL
jgi:CubicO group peptidase (beta-lactamase class C family)